MHKSERNREEGRPWLSWIVLLVLLGVALALRWRYVREISLFVDEFVTAWAAKNIPIRGLPFFPSGNLYPHGLTFTYLEAPFVAFGPFNETLARIPGLLVGLASLPMAYWVGRRLLSEQAGLIAAAAMAVDPDCIVWGGRARMYGLLQLLTLLVIYFSYRGLAEDRPRDRYLAMGLLVAAIFTHAEAAFLLPVLGLTMLIVWSDQVSLRLWSRRLFRWSVILPFAIGATGAGVFYLIARFGQPGHLETLQESRPYLALSADILRGPQAFAPVFTSLHRLPFSLLGLAGLYFVVRPRFDRRAALTYLYIALLAFLALLVLLAGATWQRERYLFMILPLLFLVGGETFSRWLRVLPGLQRTRPWQPAALALVIAIFVGLSGAPTAYQQVWGYDQAFRHLRGRFQPSSGDRIATSMCTGAMLYLDRCDAFAIQRGYKEYVIARPDDGRPADLWTATPFLTSTVAFTDLLTSASRVWFVTDGWRFQTRYNTDWILTALNHMDLEYNERGVMIFRGEGYTPLPEPAIHLQRRADFAEELGLTGFALSSTHPKPGDELEITLHWQALKQVGPAYTAFLHLVQPDNGVSRGKAGADEPLLHGLYQPDLWPKNQILPDRHTLDLPLDLEPGRYRLDLGLYRPGQADSPLSVQGADRLPLAMLTIGQIPDPPPPAFPVDVTFGDQVHLRGYDLDCDTQRLACSLQLYWEARATVERDYTVFVHLVAPDDTIAVQDDRAPGDPFFPTSTWLPGAQVQDGHALDAPEILLPGEYTLLVGLYHQPTAERLLVADAEGNVLGDALPLATLVAGSESP